ncbi:hypothetical protein [Nocardia sp. NPDC023988]|uniref:hypothetical protein n=1 Tax=unclassified Nocardia TaxID=2637762 RepID=UPI0033CCA145
MSEIVDPGPESRDKAVEILDRGVLVVRSAVGRVSCGRPVEVEADDVESQALGDDVDDSLAGIGIRASSPAVAQLANSRQSQASPLERPGMICMTCPPFGAGFAAVLRFEFLVMILRTRFAGMTNSFKHPGVIRSKPMN